MAEALPSCSKRITNEVNNDTFSKSCGSTHIKIFKHRFTWTIDNFSCCDQTNGKKLLSPKFSFLINGNESKWCLWLFPTDRTMEPGSYALVFLQLLNFHLPEIHAKYKLAIVNAKGENLQVDFGKQYFKLRERSVMGSNRFLKFDFLYNEENELLLNDKLTILCDVIATAGTENISGTTLATPQSDLSMDFAFLFHSKELSDVTLSTGAGGKEFPAHKLILATRSPVFRAMFNHGKSKSRINHVDIKDIDEDSLREMLRYMYTGKIKESEKIASCLLYVAEKYIMNGLKVICEKVLSKSLTLNNVVDMLELSDRFNALELKNQVKNLFIICNSPILENCHVFRSVL